MHTKRTASLVLMLLLVSTTASALVPNGHALTGCISTCYLRANTTVPPSEGVVYVRLDNSTFYTLPHVFNFGNATIHTIEVMNLTLYSGSSGARYVWKQWSWPATGSQWTPTTMMRTPLMEANYTLSTDPYTNAQGPFIAEFDRQFQLTIGFTDPNGQTISSPTSISMSSGSITKTLTAYNSQWVDAATWTITDAAWEMPLGAGMISGTPPTFDLTSGPVTGTVVVKAYPATLRVVDKSNNPISGAGVALTLANATSVSLTTDSQGYVNMGHVPLGAYTAKVTYNGQEQGSWSVDASTDPNYVIQLNTGGSTTAPIVSSIVIITIFGVAMLLLVLAIKVRSSAPPPKI